MNEQELEEQGQEAQCVDRENQREQAMSDLQKENKALHTELKTATNLSNARRKWWDKAREREKQLKAENKNLHFEVKVLKKFIANNEIILKSANTDVKEMTKYTKSLREKNQRLKVALEEIVRIDQEEEEDWQTMYDMVNRVAEQALKEIQ